MRDKDLPEKFYTQEYLLGFPERIATAIQELKRYKSTHLGMVEDDGGWYFRVPELINSLAEVNL